MTTKIPVELSSTPSIVDNGDATAITITSAEKVGIGVTSPFSTTQITETGWSSGAPYGTVLTVTGNNTNDANWGHLLITDSSTGTGNGGMLRFATGSTSSDMNPFAGIDGITEGGSYGGLKFLTRPNGGTATERMRIDSAGKVGIGTTSPSERLELGDGSSTNRLKIDSLTKAHYIGYDGSDDALQIAAQSFLKFQSGGSFLEAMRIDASGKVGIGTASPTNKLEVQEFAASTYVSKFMHTGNPNSGPPQIMRLDFWQTPNNGTSEFLKCRDTASGTAVNRAVIMSNGGIGNYTTNDFNYSDERMKKDISNATAQLDNIKKLQLKTFRYKEQEDSEPTNLGVVAQDIQTDFPALVTKQGEGDEARLGVKEQQIMWMAVKAIQEQQAIIEDLQTQINEVKNGN